MFSEQSPVIDMEDSDSDDVVFTRFERVEKRTSELDTAIWNSLQPVEAKAAGAKAADAKAADAKAVAVTGSELLVEKGRHMKRIRDESDAPPTIKTYALVRRVAGGSLVNIQKSTHNPTTQQTTHEDTERLLCDGNATLDYSPFENGLNAMNLGCKTAGGEEHVVQMAYHTDKCVCVTLLQGTMRINAWDTTQGWVPKTCLKRGDTCTVTDSQQIKLGLSDCEFGGHSTHKSSVAASWFNV